VFEFDVTGGLLLARKCHVISRWVHREWRWWCLGMPWLAMLSGLDAAGERSRYEWFGRRDETTRLTAAAACTVAGMEIVKDKTFGQQPTSETDMAKVNKGVQIQSYLISRMF